MRVVVDASVAVKWYLEEDHADTARGLLDGTYELIVPDLFFAEIGNVLWKRWRRGELDDDVITETLAALDRVPCETRSARPLLSRAMALAMSLQRTVYDSLYLALAIDTGARLVTADRRFHATVAAGPFAGHILWVEDL
jgi:predicted nucleic acid-binding protein